MSHRKNLLEIGGTVETDKSAEEWMNDFIDWIESRKEYFGGGIKGTEKKNTVKCYQHDCDEEAVGKAWFDEKFRWYPYCLKHLERAKNQGLPIKLFSDTDIVAVNGS